MQGDPLIEDLKIEMQGIGVYVYNEVIRVIAKNVEPETEESEIGLLQFEWQDKEYRLLARKIGVDGQTIHRVCEYCAQIGLLFFIVKDGVRRLANYKVLDRSDRYCRDQFKKKGKSIEKIAQTLHILCTESTQSVPPHNSTEQDTTEQNTTGGKAPCKSPAKKNASDETDSSSIPLSASPTGAHLEAGFNTDGSLEEISILPGPDPIGFTDIHTPIIREELVTEFEKIGCNEQFVGSENVRTVIDLYKSRDKKKWDSVMKKVSQLYRLGTYSEMTAEQRVAEFINQYKASS